MKRRNEEIDGESETNELLVELEECFGSSEKCSEGMLEKLAKDTIHYLHLGFLNCPNF
jgi:hypothetical protein